jgi:hypothetical protein
MTRILALGLTMVLVAGALPALAAAPAKTQGSQIP